MNYLKHYWKSRRDGIRAQSCLSYAKTLALFEELETRGLARLRREYDECYSIDEDSYSKKYNPEIPQKTLDKWRQQDIDEIERYGVYGVIAEVQSDGNWEEIDSIWGVIGDDNADQDWTCVHHFFPTESLRNLALRNFDAALIAYKLLS